MMNSFETEQDSLLCMSQKEIQTNILKEKDQERVGAPSSDRWGREPMRALEFYIRGQ
jgi:hypothetical protein